MFEELEILYVTGGDPSALPVSGLVTVGQVLTVVRSTITDPVIYLLSESGRLLCSSHWVQVNIPKYCYFLSHTVTGSR